ncbi:MAG: mechanosensitive ion channel [bacterium]|nr:mechanosensitive ion channel [bacterium]
MRKIRYLLLPAILAIVCTGVAANASAQVITHVGIPTPSGPLTGFAVPGIQQSGLFVTAPVTVDGAPIFRIAALASPAPGSLPIDTRLLLVQNAISQLLSVDGAQQTTLYDPNSFAIDVAREGSQYALRASDAKHRDPVDIVTVTSTDAQYAHLPDRILAEQWKSALEPALVHALQKRQPEQIRQSVDAVLRGGAILAVVTAGLALLWSLLAARGRRLRGKIEDRQQSAREHDADGDAATERRRTLARAVRVAQPEQQLAMVRVLASSIVWLGTLLWLVAITWALLLFPQTTPIGQFIIRATGGIVGIWIGALLVDRVLALAIARFAVVYAHRGLSSEERARHLLRAPTISRALGGFKTWMIVFVALLATLGVLNIPVASVVTIGGIAALAIGFAAQSLVRDILNGMLVLFEDQYVVGDYVMIGDYNGVVEGLSLRVVQIRDGRGNLITIPHSSVTQVVNASRTWSRVDYRVPVETSVDVDAALEVMRDVLDRFAAEDAWRDAVLEAYEWVGVENMSRNGVVLRASIRTAPLRQFEVRRALNERIFEAFGKAGIPLGLDALSLPTPPTNASPDPV